MTRYKREDKDEKGLKVSLPQYATNLSDVEIKNGSFTVVPVSERLSSL